VSVSKGVGLIEFCRPAKYNSFMSQQYKDLVKALSALQSDETCVVVVLTGQGKYYSSGADLSAGASRFQSPDEEDTETFLKRNANELVGSFLRALIDFPKPVIAAINGPAIGIAVTSMCLCDIVYAADSATFRTPFMELGFCAEGCSSVLFPEIMGVSKANEMLLMGKQFSATEAAQCGLVSAIFPQSQFRAEVLQRAEKMASLPARALVVTKGLMRSARRKALLHEVNALELNTLIQRQMSADCQEALGNFAVRQAEKRRMKSKL